jgi:hypothetical protein
LFRYNAVLLHLRHQSTMFAGPKYGNTTTLDTSRNTTAALLSLHLQKSPIPTALLCSLGIDASGDAAKVSPARAARVAKLIVNEMGADAASVSDVKDLTSAFLMRKSGLSATTAAVKPSNATSRRSTAPAEVPVLTETQAAFPRTTAATSPLARLPAATRRVPAAHDLWSDLAAADSIAARTAKQEAIRKHAEDKITMAIALESQIAEKRRLEMEEVHRGADAAARLIKAAKDADVAAETATRDKAARLLQESIEMSAFNREQQRLKAERAEAELQADKAALARIAAAEEVAKAKALEKKARKEAEAEAQLAANIASQRAKAIEGARRREEDTRLVKTALQEAEAKDAARDAAQRQREERIKAKLEHMSGVFEAKEAAERGEGERREEERRQQWLKEDATARQKREAAAALKAEIARNTAAQLQQHNAAGAAARKAKDDDLKRITAEAAAFKAEEARKAALKAERMDMYRRSIENQMVEDVSRRMAPDETPLDRILNHSLLHPKVTK